MPSDSFVSPGNGWVPPELQGPSLVDKKLQDGTDMASFFILDYMVGSELWEEAVKKGIIREDEYIVEGGTRHGMGKFTRSELEKWRERADHEFYMRKGYIAHEFRKFLSLRKPYMLKCAETLFACTRCLRKSSKHRNTERECSN